MLISRALPLGLGLVLAATLAACSDPNVSASGVGSTPTPASTATPGNSGTPTPAPTPATVCSFIWENADASGTKTNLYEVDVDSSVWASGTVDIDDDFVSAYYVLGIDDNNAFTSAGLALSGSITLNVSGMQNGAQASMTGSESLTFYDATGVFNGTATDVGAQSATGGTGSWSGSTSDLSSQTPAFGNGSISVNIGGTNTTFGGAASATADDVAGCSTGS